MLGPVLGADYPKLHSLVSQVPTEQRAALLAALRALSPEGRADLAVLAPRPPPQDRDALRKELLAQPESHRAPWPRVRQRRRLPVGATSPHGASPEPRPTTDA